MKLTRFLLVKMNVKRCCFQLNQVVLHLRTATQLKIEMKKNTSVIFFFTIFLFLFFIRFHLHFVLFLFSAQQKGELCPTTLPRCCLCCVPDRSTQGEQISTSQVDKHTIIPISCPVSKPCNPNVHPESLFFCINSTKQIKYTFTQLEIACFRVFIHFLFTST